MQPELSPCGPAEPTPHKWVRAARGTPTRRRASLTVIATGGRSRRRSAEDNRGLHTDMQPELSPCGPAEPTPHKWVRAARGTPTRRRASLTVIATGGRSRRRTAEDSRGMHTEMQPELSPCGPAQPTPQNGCEPRGERPLDAERLSLSLRPRSSCQCLPRAIHGESTHNDKWQNHSIKVAQQPAHVHT